MDAKGPPPPYNAPSRPAAGLRCPCTTGHVDKLASLGPPPFVDLDGSPVYVVSALLEGGKSVHPAKYVRGQTMVSYAGREFSHEVPKGRQPVEGGFEEDGAHLFHAMTNIGEVSVPGKTGTHLVNCATPRLLSNLD
ncbi:hypothetical protein OIV83_004477 [Microbotryomycetes sp. JL201]|nr:hypothetical protein OIV83_004477 [Microbotryomycetes sp. JL201]